MVQEINNNKEIRSDLFWLESPNFLISVLDAIQSGIIIADKWGKILYVNPSFIAITGLKHEDRVGRNILEIAPHCPLSKALLTGRSSYGERFQLYDAPMEILTNTKPIIVNDEIVGAVSIFQDVSEIQRLNRKLKGSEKTIENLSEKLSQITSARYGFEDMIGSSSSFHKAIEMGKRAAETDFMVLILGESGTGKELFAHSIHNASKRREKPFVKINCAAIPESLLESEFFGYEKGAFTGANKSKLGMFELANEGTIFLDEIGDMSLVLQSKLLRTLEDKEIYRVGGIKSIKVDVRVIAATNRDLKEMVKKDLFRKDLFYRLDVIDIMLPPLKDRNDDVILLADGFLHNICSKMEIKEKFFTESAYEKLRNYSWPGNIRELRNSIEKAVVMSEGNLIIDEDLQLMSQVNGEEIILDNLLPLDVMEKQMIKLALGKFEDTVEGKMRAAKALNISVRTLYNKMKKYRLDKYNNQD